MDYSQETAELIERQCRNVEREDFVLDKEKSEELIMKTYDLFNLPRPKNVKWFNDVLEQEFKNAARSARSAWSAGSARLAGFTALDYDFDWFVIEHEYIKNRKDNPGDEPNENDFKYLEYCELLMQAKEAGLGYRVEYEDTLYLVPTPIVKIDEQNRFHSTKEPAIRWKNGAEFYFLRGISFDKEWWSKIVNDELDPETIFAIDNQTLSGFFYRYTQLAEGFY